MLASVFRNGSVKAITDIINGLNNAQLDPNVGTSGADCFVDQNRESDSMTEVVVTLSSLPYAHA